MLTLCYKTIVMLFIIYLVQILSMASVYARGDTADPVELTEVEPETSAQQATVMPQQLDAKFLNIFNWYNINNKPERVTSESPYINQNQEEVDPEAVAAVISSVINVLSAPDLIPHTTTSSTTTSEESVLLNNTINKINKPLDLHEAINKPFLEETTQGAVTTTTPGPAAAVVVPEVVQTPDAVIIFPEEEVNDVTTSTPTIQTDKPNTNKPKAKIPSIIDYIRRNISTMNLIYKIKSTTNNIEDTTTTTEPQVTAGFNLLDHEFTQLVDDYKKHSLAYWEHLNNNVPYTSYNSGYYHNNYPYRSSHGWVWSPVYKRWYYYQ